MAVCLNYQSVVYPRERIRIGIRAQIVAAAFLVMMLITRVWVRLEITDEGYRLARLRQEWVDLDMERRELELKHSVLRRHDNLSKLAKERLGLVPLSSDQVWKVAVE